MSAPVTVGTMIRQIAALAGTKDVSVWEDQFIRDMVDRSNEGRQTTRLSTSQVEKIEQLWTKHFAG